MSIRFHCANCSNSISALDSAAGKRIRCPKCGASVVVPTDAEEALPESKPARSRGKTARKKSKADSRSGAPTWAWVAAPVALGSIAIVVVVVVMNTSKRPLPTAPVAEIPIAANQPPLVAAAPAAAQQPAAPAAQEPVAEDSPAAPRIAPPPDGAIEALEELTFDALSARIRGKQVGDKRAIAGFEGKRGQVARFDESQKFFDEASDTTAVTTSSRVNEAVPIAADNPRQFDNSGKRIVAEVKERESSETTFWSQGKGAYEGGFANGRRWGQWTRRHKNGRLWVIGNFEADQKSGQFLVHDENGQRLWKGIYRGNQLQSSFVPGNERDFTTLWLEATPSLIEFAPDGHCLVAATGANLTLWDGKTWKESARSVLPATITRIEFCADGSAMLVICQSDPKSKESFVVCDATTGSVKFGPRDDLTVPTLSPDGKLLAAFPKAANNYNQLAVVSLQSGKTVLSHDGGESNSQSPSGRAAIHFNSLAFTSDSRLLVVGGDTATYIFDTRSGKIQKRANDALSIVAITPDNQWALGTLKNGQLAKMELKTGKPGAMGFQSPSSVAMTPDGVYVVASRQSPQECAVKVIDAATGKSVFDRSLTASFTQQILSPDHRRWASISFDTGKTVVWNLISGEKSKALPQLLSPAFSANGMILSGFEKQSPEHPLAEQQLILFHLDSDQVRRIELSVVPCAIPKPQAFSADGKFLAVALSDLSIVVFDISDFNPVRAHAAISILRAISHRKELLNTNLAGLFLVRISRRASPEFRDEVSM